MDAGFSCPNRDGFLSNHGCIYCDEGGSFSRAQDSSWPISKQLEIGINKLKNRFKAKKFISYFQAYSNTYDNVNRLKNIYNQALTNNDVVGLSIATRPDCIDIEKIRLIEDYTSNYYVWLEYGVQSIHNKTLKLINRGYTTNKFFESYELTRKYGPNIKICTHVILGLPGETKKDILETAKKINDIGVDGVKIHLLCVLKNTTLEKIYLNGDFTSLNQDEYVNIASDFLEHLSPSITIHRIAGNGLKKILVYPAWLSKKFEILNQIDKELERRNSFQGDKC